MTRPKYPPLPTINRPRFRLIRTLGVAIALAALAVAWLAARAGRWDMVATVLAMGGGFGALPWIHPLSPWFLLVQAGAGLATGWLAFQLTGRWWVALVLTTPLLIGLLSRPLVRRRLSSLDPDNVQIGAPDLVMENAEAFQEEFLANGFTPVGAVTFVIRGTTVISSLLISPDSRSYASVTDAILNVTSVFPSGQVLVTRNNDVSPLPAYVLTNGLSGATPGELIVGHVEALALLAAHDHHPILLAADEIPRRAVDSGREGIIWLQRQTDLKVRAGERGPLVDRKNSPGLIQAWEAASTDRYQDGKDPTT